MPHRAYACLSRWALPLLILVQARPSHAQAELAFFTNALKSVHSVTLAGQFGDLTDKQMLGTSDSDCALLRICGMAAEVLFDVTTPEQIHLEIGFGASYLRGFHEKAGLPFDIRGSVRSFPTISAYLTGDARIVEPYVGVNFGIADLWNVQVYDTLNREFKVTGQTFELGGTAGFYLDFYHSVGLFAEASYRRRRFASLDYTRDSVPGIPRELNLDALTVALGVQFDLREDKEGPPAFYGTWVLSKVNGEALPARISQRQDGNLSVRDELTSGMLDITAQNYVLRLWHRQVTLSAGQIVAVTTPDTLPSEFGTTVTEETADDMLLLHPQADLGRTVLLRRVDKEIMLRHNNHVLHFVRIGATPPVVGRTSFIPRGHVPARAAFPWTGGSGAPAWSDAPG